MSQVLTRVGAPREKGESGHSPHSPVARRLQNPRWRDARLLSGVLLILASVVVGVKLVGSASRTSGWVSVTSALPAGHVLVARDLRTVQAHLPASSGGRYFGPDASALIGKTLSSSVAAGELLPAAAIATAAKADSRIVPVIVRSGRLPELVAGDRVDLYVLSKSTGPSGSNAGREVRVLSGAEFVTEDVLNSGDTSVQLRVIPADAITAVAASQSGRADLVRIDGGATGATGSAGGSAPSSIDGFGSS